VGGPPFDRPLQCVSRHSLVSTFPLGGGRAGGGACLRGTINSLCATDGSNWARRNVTSRISFGAGIGEQNLKTELSASAIFESPVGPDPTTETMTALPAAGNSDSAPTQELSGW
jgi:hypothetical protein